MTSDELDIGENIFYKKAKTGDLDEILEQYLEGKNLNELTKNMDLYNYMGNANIQQFVEHLSSMLYDKIKTDKAVEKYILNKDKAKKILKDGKIVNSSTKVSLLENFILSLIYTLRIHDFSNEQLYGVWKGLSKGVSSALTKVKAKGELSAEIQDKIDEAGLDLRSDIHNTIASM